MDHFINEIRSALKAKNYYAALFIALNLPDICKKLENPADTNSFARYKAWFDHYMPQYKGFLSANDCYALRCSVLHEGSSVITSQAKQLALEHFLFIEDGSHCNLFKGIQGKSGEFLQLSARRFCEEICEGVELWLKDHSADSQIQDRIAKGLRIHPPGYNYHGIQIS